MRCHIPKAMKDMALHMMNDEALTDKLIHCYTGISMCSLKRLRQTYRETGDSVRTPVCNGRPHILDSLETAVSSTLPFQPYVLIMKQFLEGCIERQPDVFLLKLQDLLREVCGTHTSIITISRTLQR